MLKHRNIQSLTRITAVQDRTGLFLLCKYGINPYSAVNTTKKGCDYMFPSEKEYGEMTKRLSPPSSKLKDFIWAYAVGGLICVIGQLIMEWFTALDMPEKVVKAVIPSLLIFIAAWLTGLKLFDKIAKHAGAGTLVPITGFANAVVSPAIEYKSEGFVLGLGAKMFTIAGPVIVYGTLASVIYGIILYIMSICG